MADVVSLEELYRQAVTFPGSAVRLDGLQNALNAVEEAFAHAIAQTSVRFQARERQEGELWNPDDLEDYQHNLKVTIEQVFPSVFFGGFVLTLWSVFEFSVKRMAEYACQEQHLPSPKEDFMRGHFINTAANVYSRLGIAAFPDKCVRDQLDALRSIRNALAHHHGQVAALPASLRTAERLVDLDLPTYRDLYGEPFFVPSGRFLRTQLELVRGFLTSLAERAYKAVHPVPLIDGAPAPPT